MSSRYEQAAEEFLQSIGREYYLNGSGQKDTLDVVPIYEKYAWLFDRTEVDRLLSRQDPEGRYMAAFAADSYMDNAAKVIGEKITNQATQAKVDWDGEQVPYRRVSLLISNEPDRERRHELESRMSAKTEELNPDRLERLQQLHSLATELGYSDYLTMYDQLKQIRFPWLLARMGELLEKTEDVYASELAYYLGKLGVASEDATPADLAFLFRAPEFDTLFPQDRLVESLRLTLSGMGIDLDTQKNIHLDTESRPLKSPRAFCAPVQLPDEVYLVIAPKGGQDDYKAIFHESGHAEHFGHVSPDLPLAFKRFGDGAVSESYAFLMDNLLKNRHWFAKIMGQHDADDYLRLARFHKLWILRRYAAKLHYEGALHTSGDLSQAPTLYAETLGKALGLKVSPANYLSDVDDGLYAASYLRAWIFEVMLRKHMEEAYGQLWFCTPEAGSLLVDMWRQGQTLSVDDLARKLRYERLDAEPLIRELAG